jgi:hypothetical protein
MTANRSTPSASATAATSAAAEATSRPGVGRRPAVAGPVVGDPAEAESLHIREERFGWRADVRGAVVPEDGEPIVRAFRGGVVRVQRPTVLQLHICLGQAMSFALAAGNSSQTAGDQ